MKETLYEQAQKMAVTIAAANGYETTTENMRHWSRNARSRQFFNCACLIMSEHIGHEMYDVIDEYEEDHMEATHEDALDLNKNWHKEVQRIKYLPKAYAMAVKINEALAMTKG